MFVLCHAGKLANAIAAGDAIMPNRLLPDANSRAWAALLIRRREENREFICYSEYNYQAPTAPPGGVTVGAPGPSSYTAVGHHYGGAGSTGHGANSESGVPSGARRTSIRSPCSARATRRGPQRAGGR
eukprot:4805885-Pyramimonas_sp.AAC.1